jgi:hypothetical protein
MREDEREAMAVKGETATCAENLGRYALASVGPGPGVP